MNMPVFNKIKLSSCSLGDFPFAPRFDDSCGWIFFFLFFSFLVLVNSSNIINATHPPSHGKKQRTGRKVCEKEEAKESSSIDLSF